MKALRRLWDYVKPEWLALSFALLCMLVLAFTTAFYAFLAGPALKFIFSGDFAAVLRDTNGELRSIWQGLPEHWLKSIEQFALEQAILFLPALIVITATLKGFAQTGQFFILGRTAQRVLLSLRQHAFKSMLKLSPGFFVKHPHGDLLSRLTHDANLVEQSFFYGWAPIIREPLSVLFLLGFCFYTDPTLALYTFITIPLALFPLSRFARWIKRVAKRSQSAQGEINTVCDESLSGIRVVQAFNAQEREANRLKDAGLRYYQQLLKSYFIRAARTPTMEILGSLALAFLLAFLGKQIKDEGADPAHLMSFFIAVVMMYDPLKKLGNVSDYLANGAAASERIFEIIDLEPEIKDAENAVALQPFSHSVIFQDVGFKYDEEPVLSNVNLELKRGQVVALVGSSGSGKTTMAHLLPRFFDCGAGQILIDGHPLRQLQLASLREQISVVGQDTFLFNTSVFHNIAYGAPHASKDEVISAAKNAFAHEFVEQFSDGYAHIVGERGIKLSGGQRQRIAIARALLRNTPLLILDEATSALDIESERFVQKAIEKLMENRTCLVIAHRLTTIQRADTIAVLKEGRIVEQGSHETLMSNSGEYARLYDMQFETLGENTLTIN